MTYLLTNQNNFAHVPYPCASFPQATVKSGGCGPCSVLNCVENMTARRFQMAEWIRYVMANGGRIDGGTSITAILKALKRDYGFGYQCTNNLTEVKSHLKQGGFGVFHGGYGNVFSSAGHFVCLAGIRGNQAIVLDSAWYQAKYSSSYRKKRVTEGKQKGLLYVDFAYVEADKKYKQNQAANYYLITAPKEKEEEDMIIYKTEKDVPEYGQKTVKKLVDKGFLCGTGNGELNISEDMLRILVVLDRAGAYEK